MIESNDDNEVDIKLEVSLDEQQKLTIAKALSNIIGANSISLRWVDVPPHKKMYIGLGILSICLCFVTGMFIYFGVRISPIL